MEAIHILKQLIHHRLLLRVWNPPVVPVALDVLGQEFATSGAGRHLAVVAVVASPFGEMVGKIECSRGWVGVFVVDEVNRLDLVVGSGSGRL